MKIIETIKAIFKIKSIVADLETTKAELKASQVLCRKSASEIAALKGFIVGCRITVSKNHHLPHMHGEAGYIEKAECYNHGETLCVMVRLDNFVGNVWCFWNNTDLIFNHG